MKKLISLLLIFVLIFSGCGQNPDEETSKEILSEEPSVSDETPENISPELEKNINPYLSIYYLKNNEGNPDEKERVILCYDINTQVLTEVCVLPKENHIVSAKYSRANNTVYYFGKTDKNDYYSECGLWKYDIDAKETVRLDNENHSYNELEVIDENTLLLMMVTNEHPIMPVLYDIVKDEFTYMADANNEPFIYTSGPLSLSYNHATEELACIYWSEKDVDSDYNSFKKSINYYLSAADKNLVKDPNRTFSYSSKINENNFWHATQLSENEYIVAMHSGVPSNDSVEYYSLVFGDDEPSFTKTKCPYPHTDYVWNLQTIDGGNTFYFYLRSDDLGNPSGIYSYVPETKELTPIFLYDPEIAPEYVGFSLMEDGSKPVFEPESTVESEPEPEKKPVPEGYPENYMTFDEINAEGYYPLWMKPFTEIVYDENKVPSIIEGGELTDQYVLGREDMKDSAFIDRSVTFRVRPNTKAEYDLWGSIVNIYFKWPDGSYNLSPYSKTESAEITYYEDIDEYEHDKGKTVKMDDYKSHGVFWLADELSFAPESTSKPMDFPRYKITFTYVGTEHCIYIDENNVFTSTMLDGGNYVSTLGEDHFSTAAELFGE